MHSNAITPPLSRRRFLKTTAGLTLSSLTVGRSLAAALSEKGNIALTVVSGDAVARAAAPTWAIGE
jgi:hypothetical protein